LCFADAAIDQVRVQFVAEERTRKMPVSSYVIRCTPEDQSRVLSQLKEISGIEIGEPMDTGIPVATEAPTTRAASELGEHLQSLTGVKAAVLVYHNFEDVAEPAENN
jgi:nitrate reductase NapAB chaperone NapD